MSRHYYALGDSFVGFIGKDYSSGFANTKVKFAFDSAQARDYYLKSTKLLGARALKAKEQTNLKIVYMKFIDPPYSTKWEFYACDGEFKDYGLPTSKENMKKYFEMCRKK